MSRSLEAGVYDAKIKTQRLLLLSFVELWERFSYYGMRALLVLFLTKHVQMDDENALAIYSIFAALGYAGPVIAGWIADNFLGFKKMVIIGGITMVFGSFGMSLFILDNNLVYLALGAIAVGTGIFKGNISSLLGTCYEPKDPERQRGFTIFYIAINLGGVLAGLICGYVGENYGWEYGFGLSGIGMTLGLISFILSLNILEDKGNPPKSSSFSKLSYYHILVIIISVILSVTICTTIIYKSHYFTSLINYVGVFSLSFYVFLVATSEKEDRKNLIALFILIFFMMLFFAVELQLGSLINLFTDRNVNKEVFGFTIPAAASQSINPFSIIILGSFISKFMSVDIRHSVVKFILGLSCMAICFLVLYAGCMYAKDGQVDYIYLFLGISIMGLGELFISPFVQSQATLLSPQNKRGMIMGFVMLSIAFANLLGYYVSKLMAIPKVDGEIDITESLLIYKNGFFEIFKYNLLFVVIFLIFFKFVNRTIIRASYEKSETKY